MSSDTTLVVAKVDDQFRAEVMHQAEFLEHPKRKTRWKAAQRFLKPYYRGESFTSTEEISAYAVRLLKREEEDEWSLGVEHGVLRIEIDLEKHDVRPLS